ncbi:MAG: AraC family transcriptional regulator [Aurantibacter sp.]
MDIISSVLERVTLTSAVYFKSDFAAPWGMEVPQGPFAQFHMVTGGLCILKVNKKMIQLRAGDIIVFPLGTKHWLADSPNSTRKNGQEVVQSVFNGKSVFAGRHAATTLICGHFEFDRTFDHAFIQELPNVIHITGIERKELSWLDSVSNLIVKETESKKPGGEVLLRKLGEILFIHTLRAYIERNGSKKGFMAAIQDKKIGIALKTIHNNPENRMTLASLAQIAGISRTSFSNRFRTLIGDTPMGYITKWRIIEAKRLLKESDRSVGEIAEKVGYKSEAAFNRVFKKQVALTPLKFRKSVNV